MLTPISIKQGVCKLLISFYIIIYKGIPKTKELSGKGENRKQNGQTLYMKV